MPLTPTQLLKYHTPGAPLWTQAWAWLDRQDSAQGDSQVTGEVSRAAQSRTGVRRTSWAPCPSSLRLQLPSPSTGHLGPPCLCLGHSHSSPCPMPTLVSLEHRSNPVRHGGSSPRPVQVGESPPCSSCGLHNLPSPLPQHPCSLSVSPVN